MVSSPITITCPECGESAPDTMWDVVPDTDGEGAFCPRCSADFKIAECDACGEVNALTILNATHQHPEGGYCWSCTSFEG